MKPRSRIDVVRSTPRGRVTKMTMGICRLCGKHGVLKDSHLIARAFLKRFFRTSPTGAARPSINPNKRTQQYLHKPLLCHDCELRFARRETVWGRDVDQRADEQLPRSFTCTHAHRYFAASLIWRIIVWDVWDVEASEDSPFTPDDRGRIVEAEAALRSFLLGRTQYPDPPWPWLHLVTPPHGFTGAPKGLNVYLRGALDVTINGYGEGLYCYAIIGGYLVVAVLNIGDALITWTLGTELAPGRTVHQDPRRFPEDIDFRKLLVARAAVVKSVPLSERQQMAVKTRVNAVLDPNLRNNPHVIATLTDALNSEQGAEQI